MAIIGEIRKRQWLLLVVVLGALAAFVLSDALRNNGGSVEGQPISFLYGESLTQTDYDKLVQQEIAKYRRVYEQVYRQPLPSEIEQQLEEGYLNQYLSEQLYQKQYDAIGLTVTPNEFNSILQGDHIDPSIYEQNQLFVDASGRFSMDSLKTLLPLYLQQSPDFAFYLNNVLGAQAEKQRLSNKYNSLVSKGLYTTRQEAKKAFVEQNNKITFNYVFKSYSSIPDTAVEVTEDDIKKYYEEHKNEKKYEGKDAISFQYIEFPIIPSIDDEQSASSYLDTSLIRRFKESENDTTFILSNSDTKNYDFAFKKVSEFPSPLDTLLKNADTGEVFGPYKDGDFFKIAKIREIKVPQEARVRHILLGTEKYGFDLGLLQAKADSITKVIKAQNNFDAMVKAFSTDPGSVDKGGVYEWFDEYQMVPEFTAVSFNEPIGSIKTATTQYGIHIIEVLGRRDADDKLLSVATIDIEIRPSKPTIDDAINKAIEFRDLLGNDDMKDTAFVNKARKYGYFPIPVEGIAIAQKSISGFGNNVTLIKRWGFNANVGNVSDYITFDKKVIIAHLTSKSKKGVPEFDLVKEEMSYEVIKERKAALYKEKMKGGSLQEIANAIGSTVQTASSISFSQNSIPGVGSEPKVIGTAFATKPNSLSKFIDGDNGVYVLSTTSLTEATIPKEYAFDSEQKSSIIGLRSSADGKIYQALVEISGMEDNRERVNIIEEN